jgi:glutamate formiminotransferase
VFECVINVAEGRDVAALAEVAAAAGASMRDLHHDPVHHRSVFTLLGSPPMLARDVRALISAAYERFSLENHEGVHPRFGVVDVVPFVAYDDDVTLAYVLREETAQWIAETFAVPVFFYAGFPGGRERSLPQVRRHAFKDLAPDLGPENPSPRLGAVAIGVRDVLVAWNLWLRDVDLDETRRVAAEIRRQEVRALGFDVGGATQVSCNLVEPYKVGPGAVFDEVVARVGDERVVRGELVGLLPEAVLRREDPARWAQLGLSIEATIEARSA